MDIIYDFNLTVNKTSYTIAVLPKIMKYFKFLAIKEISAKFTKMIFLNQIRDLIRESTGQSKIRLKFNLTKRLEVFLSHHQKLVFWCTNQTWCLKHKSGCENKISHHVLSINHFRILEYASYFC